MIGRVAFRFCFVYLALYSIPAALLGTLQGHSLPAEAYDRLWQHVFAYHFFAATEELVQCVCLAMLALAITAVWIFLQPRSDCRWLRVFLRYTLALTLVGYGTAKVVRQQFPFPLLERMVTPFGESSPRGLLWTFMGYSYAYSFFAGAGELLAGLLLCFRRTTTLGALLAAGILANVAMLNLSFDVQLKVFSLHLLSIAIFLLLPDLRRLADFFVLGRATRAAEVDSSRPALRLAFKTILIGYALISSISYAKAAMHRRGGDAPKPELYGIYQVDEFTRNGEPVPPLQTDGSRWSKVVVEANESLLILEMDGSKKRYAMHSEAGEVTLTSATESHRLTWSGDVVTGTFAGDSLLVKLHRLDLPLLH